MYKIKIIHKSYYNYHTINTLTSILTKYNCSIKKIIKKSIRKPFTTLKAPHIDKRAQVHYEQILKKTQITITMPKLNNLKKLKFKLKNIKGPTLKIYTYAR